MADVKISGLPASTVPLAGTEVLPIVQGGTTKQVSVANLTVGRNVAAADLTTTGNTILGNASTDTLNVGNGDLVKDASGNVGIGTASPSNKLSVSGAGTIFSSVASTNGVSAFIANSATGSDVGLLLNSGGVETARITSPSGGAVMAFGTGAGAVEAMRINSSNNLLVGTTSATGVSPNNNNGSITAGAFRSFTGSVSAANNTAVTIASYPTNIGTNITYIISANVVSAVSSAFSAVSILCIDTGSISIASLKTATDMFITTSGTDVQVRQTSGVAQTVTYTFTRVS